MLSTIKRIWSNAKDFGKISYLFRSVSLVFAFIIIVFHYWESGKPTTPLFYLTLVVIIMLPTAYFIDYSLGGSKFSIAVRHLVLDMFLVGWGMGMIGLSLIPSVLYGIGVVANYMAARGLKNSYYFLLIPLGCITVLGIQGFEVHLESSSIMNGISLCYAGSHFLSLAYVMFLYNRRHVSNRLLIQEQHQEISIQNEEIKAQAEELVMLNESLKAINKQLEENVTEKTQESILKTRLLAEYAFINAHELRAPVASIMGLLQFFDYPLEQQTQQEVVDKLRISSENLDNTIKSIRIKLESQGLIPHSVLDPQVDGPILDKGNP